MTAARAFLAKPYHADDLGRELQEALDRSTR